MISLYNLYKSATYVSMTAPIVYTAYTWSLVTPYGIAIYCGTVLVKVLF